MLTLLAFALAAPVQVPVQGTLTNTAGAPLNGTFNVRFRLWHTSGSAQVWTDAGPVVFVDGAFSAWLGSPTAPLDSDLFAQDAWLSVQVGTDADSDRLPVGTAPRAAWAVDAGALDGQSLADLDARYAKLGVGGGLSVTGPVTLGAAPSAATDAVSKGYVDSAVSPLLSRAGGTLTGALTLAGPPTTALEAATKAYVDGAVAPLATTSALNNYLLRSGGTLTGALGIGSAPNRTLDVDATALNVGFTSPAGPTSLILGNRDSAAIPTVLTAANGELRIGRGTSYGTANGGTFTETMFLGSNGAARFNGALTATQGVTYGDSTTQATSPFGPAFCAILTSAVSTTTAVRTAPFNAVEFDTSSSYNASTYTYTPNKAGYYRVSVNLGVTQIATLGHTNWLYLNKNGSAIRQSQQLIYYNAGFSDALTIDTLVYLNGTSDAINASFNTNTSNAMATLTGGASWFCAEWVRP